MTLGIKILRDDISAVPLENFPKVISIGYSPAGISSFVILYGTIYSDTKLHNR
jgi:hypothetical protein